MPPCAAMECALRGESWKQKHFTLYPNSAKVAAADEPANPDPTTMISKLRLFAGFTKETEERYFVHLSDRFPSGIFEFNFDIIFFNFLKLTLLNNT
jgi:hypothetical protein